MDEAPILICYDGSAAAENAIDEAAKLFFGRRAVVLDVAPFLTSAESVAALSALTPNFGELNEEDALARARDGAAHASRVGFRSEARADLAAPTWEGIVEAADELDAAVIVIGSRGLTGARELFEGSMSHEVAEHADRPVLVVPMNDGPAA